jgi:FAD/FMN-containing dehydrogenase
VVIPLPRMAEYTDGIERINIELSLAQQDLSCVANWLPFFSQGDLAAGQQ